MQLTRLKKGYRLRLSDEEFERHKDVVLELLKDRAAPEQGEDWDAKVKERLSA